MCLAQPPGNSMFLGHETRAKREVSSTVGFDNVHSRSLYHHIFDVITNANPRPPDICTSRYILSNFK